MGLFSALFGNNNNEMLEASIKKGAYLVDVRTPQEFAEGHVPGSINIPLDNIPNQLVKFKNKNNIVVFCRSGARSGQAKSILNQNGINDVINAGPWQNVLKLVKH